MGLADIVGAALFVGGRLGDAEGIRDTEGAHEGTDDKVGAELIVGNDDGNFDGDADGADDNVGAELRTIDGYSKGDREGPADNEGAPLVEGI